jgi:hypothetical protein
MYPPDFAVYITLGICDNSRVNGNIRRAFKLFREKPYAQKYLQTPERRS